MANSGFSGHCSGPARIQEALKRSSRRKEAHFFRKPKIRASLRRLLQDIGKRLYRAAMEPEQWEMPKIGSILGLAGLWLGALMPRASAATNLPSATVAYAI